MPPPAAPCSKPSWTRRSGRGLRVAVHATELAGARVAVEAGAAVLVHSVFDQPVDDAFVAAVRDKGVVYVPTLFVTKGYDLVLSGRFRADARRSAASAIRTRCAASRT